MGSFDQHQLLISAVAASPCADWPAVAEWAELGGEVVGAWRDVGGAQYERLFLINAPRYRPVG